jgi:hypothetical protein
MRVSGFRAGAVRTLVYITLLVPQGACGAGWHRITPPAPTTLPSRQQVEVWQGGRVLRLHAVRLTNDSLSGVPFVKPPDCDSCRVGLPRAAIDSLRTGNPTAGFWKMVGLSLVGTLAVVVVGCLTIERCNFGGN